MTVNFRYKVEIEGGETVWMWHRDAAIDKAHPPHDNPDRKSKVVDEDTGKTIIEWPRVRKVAA